jgi:hypothetical protein
MSSGGADDRAALSETVAMLSGALEKARERIDRFTQKDLESVQIRLGSFIEVLEKPKN